MARRTSRNDKHLFHSFNTKSSSDTRNLPNLHNSFCSRESNIQEVQLRTRCSNRSGCDGFFHRTRISLEWEDRLRASDRILSYWRVMVSSTIRSLVDMVESVLVDGHSLQSLSCWSCGRRWNIGSMVSEKRKVSVVCNVGSPMSEHCVVPCFRISTYHDYCIPSSFILESTVYDWMG